MAKTVQDLMRVTGWSKPTVLAALRAGRLPGYQSSGKGGHWTVPDAAFERVAEGTWKPPSQPVIRIRPVRRPRHQSLTD